MTSSDYLTMAENRFGSVQRYFPNSSEANRFAGIVADIIMNMTHEERIAHSEKTIETPAMKDARLKKERHALIQMEMNKDSNSI